MEMRQETDYVLHHAQKILAIFAAMRDFSRLLREAGHRVHYITIDDPANRQSLTANLHALLASYNAGAFEYQAPDEWRLDTQLGEYVRGLSIAWRMADSEHFFYGARRDGAVVCRPPAMADGAFLSPHALKTQGVDGQLSPAGGRQVELRS